LPDLGAGVRALHGDQGDGAFASTFAVAARVIVRPLLVASFCWRIQAISFSAVPALTTRRNQSSRKK
jgi:hypothetical protein